MRERRRELSLESAIALSRLSPRSARSALSSVSRSIARALSERERRERAPAVMRQVLIIMLMSFMFMADLLNKYDEKIIIIGSVFKKKKKHLKAI